MNSATEFVIDRQNADGTWEGVAGIWGDSTNFLNTELLAALLAVFKDNDQTSTYRMVSKVRTETVEETVIG